MHSAHFTAEEPRRERGVKRELESTESLVSTGFPMRVGGEGREGVMSFN